MPFRLPSHAPIQKYPGAANSRVNVTTVPRGNSHRSPALSEHGLLGFDLTEISPNGCLSCGGLSESFTKTCSDTGPNHALTLRVPGVRFSVQRVEVFLHPKSLQPSKERPLSGTAWSVTRVPDA